MNPMTLEVLQQMTSIINSEAKAECKELAGKIMQALLSMSWNEIEEQINRQHQKASSLIVR